MFRKILSIGIAIAFLTSPVFATDAVYNVNKGFDVVGWHVSAIDDDVDNTAELITELDATYAQLAAEDEVEIVSSSALDVTQTITVSGINSSGKYVSESLAVNTTGGAFETTGDTVFRYIDQVESDTELVGTLTVRRESGDTFITSIPSGKLSASMIQHFNGEKNSYITGWNASNRITTQTATLELRWYKDDADCLDATDGYEILDEIKLPATYDTVRAIYAQPIKCSAGGWIAVYGTGVASSVSVTLQGYDLRR